MTLASPPSEPMPAGLYCSEINRAHGLDPAGNATPFERFLLVEIPLPWPRSLLKSDGVTLYQRLRAVYNEALDAGHQVRITGLVPDDEWSTPGLTRVITYRRPEGDRFATYERDEHLLTAQDDVVALARAFFRDDRDALGRFDAQREPSDGRGDLLVCTHGTYDACCGTRGTPLYRQARAELTEVRTWRVMHSGGHRYAPTAVTMPDGRAWAFLDMERTRQAVRHGGDHRQMVPLLRGW
ncbi:MAG: sucrase ferredoxin, partial [Dehalococcoidia bacterium]